MDVVYPYRKNFSHELEWSIDSLKHIKHDNVYIIGDEPPFSVNAKVLKDKKASWSAYSPYNDVAAKHLIAAKSKSISEDFILMNDDFFIMKKWNSVIYDRGDLLNRLEGSSSNVYSTMLTNTYAWLKSRGYSTKDYAVHAPFVYNKTKLLDLIERIEPLLNKGHSLSIRTLYGNVYEIESKTIKIDPKNPKKYKNMSILSTNEETFIGEIGIYIRSELSKE